MKKIIKWFMQRFGYSFVKNAKTQKGIYRQVLEHELLELDATIINYIRPNTMISNYRLKNIERIVQYINDAGIEGDFVECGVWKGGRCHDGVCIKKNSSGDSPF